MKNLFFISILLFVTCVYGQIPPEKNLSEFVVYTEHTDSINNIDYQLGRHEPKDYTFELNSLGKWGKVEITIENDENFYHVSAPIYLRVVHKETENYYFLNSYYDVDMFRFPDVSSDKLQIIAGRYPFYIYDIENQTLSHEQIPGLNQYEGEDSISGMFSALTLFDNEKFLLGNVQGFGVFCFDISNTAKPVELKQHRIKEENNGQFYAFFYLSSHKRYHPNTTDSYFRETKKFDVIIAQADVSSVSPNINRFYQKMGTIKYAIKDINLRNHKQEHNDLILFTENSSYRLNLIDGTLTKEAE